VHPGLAPCFSFIKFDEGSLVLNIIENRHIMALAIFKLASDTLLHRDWKLMDSNHTLMDRERTPATRCLG
jgi:hypothetical protein